MDALRTHFIEHGGMDKAGAPSWRLVEDDVFFAKIAHAERAREARAEAKRRPQRPNSVSAEQSRRISAAVAALRDAGAEARTAAAYALAAEAQLDEVSRFAVHEAGAVAPLVAMLAGATAEAAAKALCALCLVPTDVEKDQQRASMSSKGEEEELEAALSVPPINRHAPLT
jgi:hypothetical protein